MIIFLHTFHLYQNDEIPLSEMAYAETTSQQQPAPGAIRVVYPNGPNQQPPSVSH